MTTYIIERRGWNDRNRPRLAEQYHQDELACNCQFEAEKPSDEGWLFKITRHLFPAIIILETQYKSNIWSWMHVFLYHTLAAWLEKMQLQNFDNNGPNFVVAVDLMLGMGTKNFYPDQCRQERSLSGRSRFFLFWWEYVIWWNMQIDKISIWQNACYKRPTKGLQTLL